MYLESVSEVGVSLSAYLYGVMRMGLIVLAELKLSAWNRQQNNHNHRNHSFTHYERTVSTCM